MTTILIMGSCVTRDVFRVVDREDHRIIYYARTSLPSQMSEPLNMPERFIKLNSPFQRKMIIQDVHKSLFNDIEMIKPDIIILDFIDERFDLIVKDNTIITKSDEFRNGNCLDFIGEYDLLSRGKYHTQLLWEYSCIKFIKKLRDYKMNSRVILHKAFWSEQYLDEGGNLIYFDYQKYIQSMNLTLHRYYDFFVDNMPEATTISSRCIASTSHIWGLSAYHYSDDYYKDIYNQLSLN